MSHPVSIVVAPHASLVERFAGQELARYLRKITGQSFPILPQSPGQGTILFIGRTWAESAGLSFSAASFGDDGFLNRRFGNRIFLAGVSDRGTLYAVYAFLESLGCRWFAPNFAFYGTAGGEVVPQRNSLLVDELNVQERPAFRWRKKYVEEGESHNTENLKQLVDWMAKARYNVFNCPMDYQHQGRTKWDNWRQELLPELKKRGLLIEVGGHGYPNFLSPGQHFQQHPEWFGTQNGVRSPAENIVFSTANPQAVQTFTRNVESFLEAHPEIDIFDAWPPDDARWSDAPEDVALGSPSQRQLILLNGLAKQLQSRFPKVLVQFIAYQTYVAPPSQIRPGPGVVMEFCPIDRSFESRLYSGANPQNARYFGQLEQWFDGVMDPGKVTIYSYITKYLWRSLPVLIPYLIADESRRFHEMGLGGFSAYSEPNSWATFELDHYTMARFSWNADLNVDREIHDYALHRYGAAAAPMEQFLKLVEEVVPHAVGIPGTTLTLQRQRELLDRFTPAAQYLEQARQLALQDSSLLLLIGKMSAARAYAENEMRLRLAFLEGAAGWRRKQFQTIQELLRERTYLIEQNAKSGVILNDGRLQ